MSETTAIATRSQLAPRPALTLQVIETEKEQRELLMRFIDTQMVLDTDYGVIPGTTKRTLLKPGAEKLTNLFRCAPRFTITDKIEDWETGLFHYQFKCEIESIESGMIVAEGFGSCSTHESKYWQRNEDRKCPSCGKPTIKKSKRRDTDPQDFIPGWYCWGKIGGCGEQFIHNDPTVVDQIVGKVKNPDIYDCVNTVLKMAKKRAHVDATFPLARCSDLFEAEEFADVIAESARKNEKYDQADAAKPAANQSQPQTETRQQSKSSDSRPANSGSQSQTASSSKPATNATQSQPPAKKATTRYEKQVEYWSAISFNQGSRNPDPVGIQFVNALDKFHKKNLDLHFAPTNPDDESNVMEFVRTQIDMGDDAEWDQLTKPAVDLGCKAVLAWLKLCPTEPAK